MILFTTSMFALGQANKVPDTSPGPVPPAIEQMPSRFQPPVPGCTDCYYTVPSAKVVGAMGTTNNEDVKVTNPRPQPASLSTHPATATPGAILPRSDHIDLGFKPTVRAWPVTSNTPLPLFIGSTGELSTSPLSALTLNASCNLDSIDYTTQAGTPTTISIPLSLWDVTTKSTLADLPTDWNSWKVMTYPTVSVGKQLPAGHKVQIRLTQPASSTLPVNFQFNIAIKGNCIKTSEDTTPLAVDDAPKPTTRSVTETCQPGYKSVTSNGKTTCIKK
jgi:hypothetical protein